MTYAAAHSSTAPRGKGIWVRTVRHAPSPAAMVALCREMGAAWVAIAIAWQFEGKQTRTYALGSIPAYAAALRSAGIDVWLWAWPVPGKAAEIVRLYSGLGNVGSKGLIVDPEAPWQGEPSQVAAAAMAVWRKLGVPIGVTTYGGGPANHPYFPWRGFASADFGMPQLYDTHHKYGVSNVKRWIESWRESGFDRLSPIWGASNAHTPDQMRAEIEQTDLAMTAAGTRYASGSWWDYYWLELSKARRQIVARTKIPFFGGAEVA